MSTTTTVRATIDLARRRVASFSRVVEGRTRARRVFMRLVEGWGRARVGE